MTAGSPPIDVDALKRDYPVTTVAGRWVKLRAQRQGKFTMSGPCPLHSLDSHAVDSTSFACNDEAWVCATCHEGGDVLRLVARKEGLDPQRDFRAIVALLTGGATAATLSPEEARALEADRTERAALREAEHNEYRDRERRIAWDLYFKHGARLGHPRAAAGLRYLNDCRGLDVGPEILLRVNPEARFYVPDRPKAREIHRGPALLGMIRRDGRFAGVHQTFIDLAAPKGKARVVDPKTGASLDAKKMRGTKTGGHIELTPCEAPHILILGEGIEKVLAIYTAFRAAGRDIAKVAFWSAGDLGNLGGKHADHVPHPSARNANGRVRRVPGPTPDLTATAIEIPESVTRLVLLGDSTSDRFATQCVMARAAARYARPGRDVVCAWGPEGRDFDDVLREATQ